MPFLATAGKAQEFMSFSVSLLSVPFFGAEKVLCTLFCEPVRMLKWVCVLGTEGCHLTSLPLRSGVNFVY